MTFKNKVHFCTRLIGLAVFNMARHTKSFINDPEAFVVHVWPLKAYRCAHSHERSSFSHEALSIRIILLVILRHFIIIFISI